MLPRLRSHLPRKVVGLALFVALTGVAYAAPSAALADSEPGVLVSTSTSNQIFSAGTASFGPALVRGGSVGGQVKLALDEANATGPSTTDACTALTNPSDVHFDIALVDRGTCGFTVKVKNAQDAGALGVIVVNDVPGPAGGMAGSDPTITIPSVMVSQELGAQLKAPSVPTFAGLGLWDTTAPGVFDLTPPVLTVPSELVVNATDPSGALVTDWGVSATDNVDPAPLFGCFPFVPNQFPIGSTLVTCLAEDANQNFADEQQFVLRVKGASEQMRDLTIRVAGLGLANGTAKKLGAKLTDADAAITAGDSPGACLALQGFISEVQKAGKKIAATDAAQLVADAARITAVLGC